jgi:hypothetical protein
MRVFKLALVVFHEFIYSEASVTTSGEASDVFTASSCFGWVCSTFAYFRRFREIHTVNATEVLVFFGNECALHPTLACN